MTTSAVLGLVGGLLILVGLIGGGFSFSGTMMPTVSRVARIPCFIVGAILVSYSIALALNAPNPSATSTPTSNTSAPNTPISNPSVSSSPAPSSAQGVVVVAGGGDAYVFQYPSLEASKAGRLANGTNVGIQCTTQGGVVTFNDLSSSLWDRIVEGYIPDVMVYTGTDQPTMPNCGR